MTKNTNTIYLIRVVFFYVHFIFCNGVNFECGSLDSDDLSEIGKAQYIREHPPPYRFYFLDENNNPVRHYKEGIYSIHLNGTTYFRRFLIQTKLTTKNGYVMRNFAHGEFMPFENDYKLMSCSSEYNNTITNVDDEKKFSLRARWIPRKNDGPIQFIITVEQEQDMYWYQWTPRLGRILPENKKSFVGLYNKTTFDNDETKKGSKLIIPNSNLVKIHESSATIEPTELKEILKVVTNSPSDSSDNCVTISCLNGAKCATIDTKEICKCSPGFMGNHCHRPCQNIYRSCESWKGDDSCNSLRNITNFFDINCPVSCNQCIYDDRSVKIEMTLPPLLEPLKFLLGIWNVHYNSSHHFPTDFLNLQNGYYEEIEFSIPNISMFGMPNVNFKSVAISKENPADERIYAGFLNLIELDNLLKIALTTTGNDGLTLIEEGEMLKSEISMESVYILDHPGISSTNKIPNKINRKLSLHGHDLLEMVERFESDGTTNTFVKKYGKLKSYVPY